MSSFRPVQTMPLCLLQGNAVDHRLGQGILAQIIGEVGKENLILRRADVVDHLADGTREHAHLRGIARGDDDVPGIVGDLKALQLLDNAGHRARGVGQKDDLATGAAEALQGRNCGRIGSLAVVQAAPEVAENGIVAAGKIGERTDDFGHSGCLYGGPQRPGERKVKRLASVWHASGRRLASTPDAGPGFITASAPG
jgi:hypothetical protein